MTSHQDTKKSRPEIILFLIFLIILLMLGWFRDWEYDEAWTYLAVKGCSLWELITYSKFRFANNHALNSTYFWILQHLGITRPFFFRLISILGFVLFYSAISRILMRLSLNRWWYLLFLTVTPYFFYFTLGRGYGLAVGSFAFSFYYFLTSIDSPRIRDRYLFVTWGLLSCVSIFSFLYPFLAQLLVLAWYKRKELRNGHTVAMGLAILAVVAYVGKMGKIVNAYDPSIIGSETLFKNGTISSIVTDLSYFNDLFENPFYKYLRILVALSLVVPLFYGLWNRDKDRRMSRITTLLFILMGVCLLEMVAAHVLARAKYPLVRAVFYIEFFLLLLLVIKTQTVKNVVLKFLPLALIFIMSLFEIIHSIADLGKAGVREVLARPERLYVIYTTSVNPSLPVTNSTFGINKQNIAYYRNSDKFVSTFKKDSGMRLIYCPEDFRDSLPVPMEKVADCRDKMQLYMAE